jgi:threonine/homoserine/homoserine lactone efflux protein
MAFDSWLAFTLATIVLTLIPGPSVLLLISLAIARGKKAAMMCIVGDMFGTVVLMALSFLGVGVLLAASAVLFQLVKWAGVLYLAYLGLRQILDARKQPDVIDEEASSQSPWNSLWAGSVTAILNPKAIIFYMAFLAQFVDPDGNFGLQMGILTLTSIVIVAVLLSGYAMIAGYARACLKQRSVHRKIGYAGGSLMLGGSALMAATR